MKHIHLLGHYYNWISWILVSDLARARIGDFFGRLYRVRAEFALWDAAQCRGTIDIIDKRSFSIRHIAATPVVSALRSSRASPLAFPLKIPITFIVGVTGRDQTTSHSPTGLPRMLAPRFVSDSRIQLPLPSPWREYGRREDRKGKETRRESVRWRFEGGNELPASTTLVMTRLPCLSLSSLRRSFPSVIPRQWSHLKPPARRQNDSLDSLLNEMLHFPILFNFPKIEAPTKSASFFVYEGI